MFAWRRRRLYGLSQLSPLDQAARIHFASFNSPDQGAGAGAAVFNEENCRMTADFLTENVGRLHGGSHPAKFWCEKGEYRP